MSVELIIGFLKEHGRYTPVSEALHIFDIDFHFDGVLHGPDNQAGLVLIHAASSDAFIGIFKKIRAFTLALERSESLRTVTLVLVGARPEPDIFAELNRLCRVLLVPSIDNLLESLAPLLPLTLPPPLSPSETADVALRSELGEAISDPLITRMLRSARDSEEEVQKTMRLLVDEVVTRTDT